MGLAADAVGLRLALGLPATCYLFIAYYGWYCRGHAAIHSAPEERRAAAAAH
jgi:hypothetical protein